MPEKRIAITMGDPAGIGPEIILKTLNCGDFDPRRIVLIANTEIMSMYSDKLGLKLPSEQEIIDIPFDVSKITPRVESAQSGELSYLALEKACAMANSGQVNAIVTAPLSKNAINKAGYKFSGQTEILEKLTGKQGKNKAEMLFVAGDFKVMLLTRHIPFADVSKSLNKEKIIESVRVLHTSLREDFKIEHPKIALCGLNPHAGEGGLIGSEEITVLIPAMNELKELGIDIEGAFPADMLFAKAARAYLNGQKQPYDCYLACYHDQGLIPIKSLAVDKTVNTTIGLPVIRTSPAHGTAFDIAGSGKADFNSMCEAVKLAFELSGF